MNNIWLKILEVTFLCFLVMIATTLVLGIWVGSVVYFSMAIIGFYTYLNDAVNNNGFLENYKYWNIHYDYE